MTTKAIPSIYHAPQWLAFRSKILEKDEHQCTRCAQSATSRSLQVHHKYYIPHRLPWQYPESACLVLCSSCHAQYHGKRQPMKGWHYMGHHYCRKGRLLCENCTTKIKHCFFIFHAQWGTLQVGTVCCDRLTSTTYARDQRGKVAKRNRYLNPTSWEKTDKGNLHRRYKGRHILVFQKEKEYQLKIEDTFGRKVFATQEDAQHHAFDIIHDGILQRYEEKQRSG